MNETEGIFHGRNTVPDPPVGRVFLGPSAGQNQVVALLADILAELRGIREALISDEVLRMSPEARLAVIVELAKLASRG